MSLTLDAFEKQQQEIRDYYDRGIVPESWKSKTYPELYAAFDRILNDRPPPWLPPKRIYDENGRMSDLCGSHFL
jgi:hypothetical protein